MFSYGFKVSLLFDKAFSLQLILQDAKWDWDFKAEPKGMQINYTFTPLTDSTSMFLKEKSDKR